MPADFRRVRTLHHLLHPAESQAANGLPHVARAANEAAHPLDFQCSGRFFCRQPLSVARSQETTASSAPRPRDSATFAASFRCSSASKVALITLCGFDVPIDLVSTF